MRERRVIQQKQGEKKPYIHLAFTYYDLFRRAPIDGCVMISQSVSPSVEILGTNCTGDDCETMHIFVPTGTLENYKDLHYLHHFPHQLDYSHYFHFVSYVPHVPYFLNHPFFPLFITYVTHIMYIILHYYYHGKYLHRYQKSFGFSFRSVPFLSFRFHSCLVLFRFHSLRCALLFFSSLYLLYFSYFPPLCFFFIELFRFVYPRYIQLGITVGSLGERFATIYILLQQFILNPCVH